MKTHALKISGIVVGIIISILIVIWVIAPKLLDINRYHALIVSELEHAVGGNVELGRISWGIRRGSWIEVDSLSVVGASAFHGDV